MNLLSVLLVAAWCVTYVGAFEVVKSTRIYIFATLRQHWTNTIRDTRHSVVYQLHIKHGNRVIKLRSVSYKGLKNSLDFSYFPFVLAASQWEVLLIVSHLINYTLIHDYELQLCCQLDCSPLLPSWPPV